MTELESGRILPTKILVREFEKKETLVGAGLLYKPATVKEPMIRGEVVLTGSGTPQVEMSVRVGEQILFSPHVFQKVLIDNFTYFILDVRDCLFIMPPKAN